MTIPPLFGKEKISGSISSISNNRNSNIEPKSIIGRYRQKFGSLKVGEIERIQLSVKSSDVIAEGHEQNRREHHLKAKRSWLQSDSTLQNMECFFLSAMPNSGFSQSLKSMENEEDKFLEIFFLQTSSISQIIRILIWFFSFDRFEFVLFKWLSYTFPFHLHLQ